jgi:predicted nucleic acid-binding protein
MGRVSLPNGRGDLAPTTHLKHTHSTIIELELWQGIRPGEAEWHEALLTLLERAPLDGAIARRAGQLWRQYGLAQRALPDAAIAATAELAGCTLLTRNTGDFEVLADVVTVEFYDNGRGSTRNWRDITTW